jgi:hypothetical protein
MTVQEMKDEIARGGLGQEEKWEREGMRLVWQGRIVRDEERVGEIVGNVSQTFLSFFGSLRALFQHSV